MSDSEEGFVDPEEEIEVKRALDGPATIPPSELANLRATAGVIPVEMVFGLLPTGLRAALQTGTPCTVSFFFSDLLPWIHANATKYDAAFRKKYPRSIEGDVKTEFVPTDDILTVVCGAFLSCIEDADEDGDFQKMTMLGAFESRRESTVAIIQCWLNYLVENHSKRRVSTGMIVARHNAQNKDLQAAIKADPPILPVTSSDRPIEGHTCACQADFANALIGGSTLNGASIQEEIMIAQKPDLLFLLWWAARMSPGEALSATAEPFNTTKGYSRTFEFVSTAPTDQLTCVNVSSHFGVSGGGCVVYPEVCVAMDAYNRSVGIRGTGKKRKSIESIDDQERTKWTPRDLKKAFAAAMTPIPKILTSSLASSSTTLPHSLNQLVTGNWGCGVFGGNPRLMATIQLAAISLASHANPDGIKEMVHCHFEDKNMMDFGKIMGKLQGKTVQHLLSDVLEIQPQTSEEKTSKGKTVKHVQKRPKKY